MYDKLVITYLIIVAAAIVIACISVALKYSNLFWFAIAMCIVPPLIYYVFSILIFVKIKLFK